MAFGGKNAFIMLCTYLLVNALHHHASVLKNEVPNKNTDPFEGIVQTIGDPINATLTRGQDVFFTNLIRTLNKVRGSNESDVTAALIGRGPLDTAIRKIQSQNGAVNLAADNTFYKFFAGNRPKGFRGESLGKNNSISKIFGNDQYIDFQADTILRYLFGQYRKSPSEGKQD